MKIEFTKYQGAGNDFILIDNQTLSFPTKGRTSLIQAMCSRKFGIGSDGLILIQKHHTADFYMEFYNPDGSQSFCGNGSRCAVIFAKELGLSKDNGHFLSRNGKSDYRILDSKTVKLKMFDVKNIETGNDYYFMDTGSPHYILFSEAVSQIDIVPEAHKIRYNNRFKEVGTNVNYVEQIANGIKVRTYERGVEAETLACGTGVTACAIAQYLHSKQAQQSFEMNIKTKGGDLSVSFRNNDKKFTDIYLTGPATFVFKGSWNNG